MINLIADFNNTLKKYNMVAPGDNVLVAVSGGPDSVALFHLFNAISKKWKLKLYIGHLNHMVRGKYSDEDADFVSQLGSDFDVPVFMGRVDVSEERFRLKTSFQEAARILRYDFLEDTSRNIGVNKIALGHNANDQAETILINFLRGSGATGLTGMAPVRGCFIRPLFHIVRSDILRFLKRENISFRTDASNLDRRYLRNRIRLDLVPRLVEGYNPRIQETLMEMAEIFRDENGYMEEVICLKWDLCFLNGEKGFRACIDLNIFLKQHPALKKRIIRKAIQFIKGDLRRVTAGHIRSVNNLAASSFPGKLVQIPGSIEVLRGQQDLVFGRDLNYKNKLSANNLSASIPLKIPGLTFFKEAGVKFQTQIVETNTCKWNDVTCNEAFLDFELTGEDLNWRFFRPGDRLIPLGMNYKKNLKSFFVDAKISSKNRSRVPLLITNKGNIIWVYGHRISNSYKITTSTRKTLHIKGATM